MDLQTTFTVPASESEVRKRIDAFFTQAGYTSTGSQPPQFRRGSLLGSMASFSPRKWQVTVYVVTTPRSPEATDVAASFAVNTTGQWVTAKERAVWDAEVSSFSQSVLTGKISTEPTQRAAAKAKSDTLRAIIAFFAVALVVGLLVGLGGMILTGQSSFSYAGIIVGILAGYAVLQRYFGVGKQQ